MLSLRDWWMYGPLVLFGCAGCGPSLPPDHPCSEENPETAAFLALCAAQVRLECNPDPAVPCEAEARCEAAWARRCEQVAP